ncbi:hypothetical protein chiPu_0005041 [Chiloscyllium punctatum]|uniref:Uncharacterized protein n=1 Tax=Chiloscyllium punctatum TaxID=137246 RepID=A0A401S8B5_CHIPU|nr:hypothetical protein [Chiloscyllium punctatum]
MRGGHVTFYFAPGRVRGGHVTFRFAPRRVRGGHVTFCFTPRKGAGQSRDVPFRAQEVGQGGHVMIRFAGKRSSRGVRHQGMRGGGEWSQINSQGEDNSTSVYV